MALPLIMAGASIVGGISKAIGGERARKSQIAGLRKLSEVTPAERAYEKRRQDIIKGGDPLINQMGQQAIQTIRQQGQLGRQRATGQAIQQGLENSIVAQELRRKVDKDVLRSVAEQARSMAFANQKAKRQAEDELEKYRLGIDDRKRQTDSQIAQIGGYDRFGALTNIALGAGKAYLGSGGSIPGMGSQFANVSQGDIDAMSNMQYESYLDDFFK